MLCFTTISLEKSEINKRTLIATKWSLFAEVFAKVFGPISSIILARLLSPEAYGVVATVNMVIAFANLFSDAGFQKYLLQATFENSVEKYRSVNVAFWTNLLISAIIYIVIVVFSSQLCNYVGTPGLEMVLITACLAIPISSFSSIQRALFKRDLDFKTLFRARIISMVIPLFITIPIAFITKSYWALILGNLALSIVNSIYLTVVSKWKPSFYFNYSTLKEMFSFGVWVTLESTLSWLTSYLDIFLIGMYLSSYFLGLYKTATIIVAQIFSLITAAVIPVLTPSLSKYKNNKVEFVKLFSKYQKILSIISLPIGVVVFMNADFITRLVLGNQWDAAASFIGMWSLMNAFALLIIQFKSAALVAIGKPKYLVYGQILYITIFIPIIYYSVKIGFEFLYTTRTLLRLVPILISLFLITKVVKINLVVVFKNIFPSLLASIAMLLFFYLIEGVLFNSMTVIVSIVFAIIFYFVVLLFFKEERLYLKTFAYNVVLMKIKKWI